MLYRILVACLVLCLVSPVNGQTLDIQYGPYIELNGELWQSRWNIPYTHNRSVLVPTAIGDSTLILQGQDANYLPGTIELIHADFIVPEQWASFIDQYGNELRARGWLLEWTGFSIVSGEVSGELQGQAIVGVMFTAGLYHPLTQESLWGGMFTPLQSFSSLSVARNAATTLSNNAQFTIGTNPTSCQISSRDGTVSLGILGGPIRDDPFAALFCRVYSVIAIGSAVTVELLFGPPGP